jgi:hypothetical protein
MTPDRAREVTDLIPKLEAAGEERFEPFRQEVRQRWGRMSAYRLGALVGEAGLDWPSPYGTAHLDQLYTEGRDYHAALKAREAGEEE